VIDTGTNTVVAVLPVDEGPIAFGVFIQPIAGTPGNASCYGIKSAQLLQFPADTPFRTSRRAFATVPENPKTPADSA
jgi:hypothetical protein